MVAEKLMKDGYNAEALHDDLSQAQRDYVMKKFRGRNLQILGLAIGFDRKELGLNMNVVKTKDVLARYFSEE